MHEMSLIRGLMGMIEGAVSELGACRITKVKVRLGALSNFSEGHFREHFEEAAAGTKAEGATLEVLAMTDPTDANAQHVLLDSVEIEEEAS